MHRSPRPVGASGHSRSRRFAVALVCALAIAPVASQGTWLPPFNWGNDTAPDLNTLHVGVIPTGPQQGRVVFLTWDAPGTQPGGVYWGILDPEATPIANRFVHVALAPDFGPNRPPDQRSLAEGTCSGHAWTLDGRWFMAGGQVQHWGSDGAWMYDPDVVAFGGPVVGAWFAQPAMSKRRYYPTVLLTQIDPQQVPQAPRGEMIVPGGSIEGYPPPTDPYQYNNDYETFRPGPRGWSPTQPPPTGRRTDRHRNGCTRARVRNRASSAGTRACSFYRTAGWSTSRPNR